MVPADRGRFAALLAQLGTAFLREVDAPLIELYWGALADVDADALARAVARHIQTETDRFGFPTVATLRALSTGPNGLPRARGSEIFNHLLSRDAPGPRNAYGDPPRWNAASVETMFGAAAREAFLAAGGWSSFTNPRDQDVPFIRRDFLDAYPEALVEERAGRLESTTALPPEIADTVRQLAAAKTV